MERLKMMKEQLMTCVQGELGNLSQADATELGAAVDMIKDLSEAIYYCTIVESMEEKEKEEKYYSEAYNYRDMDRGMGRMYYDASERGNNARGGGTRGYEQGSGSRNYAMEYESGGGGSRNYAMEYENRGGRSRNYPMEYESGSSRNYEAMRDYKEGQSPLTRKSYMERKMHGGDKQAQMRELEKYVQELTRDLTEMVEGSSAEEKQMLQQKLNTLANKIV